MDILRLLLDRGCIHLILKILSSLDSWDLEVVGHVCQIWGQILHRLFWPHRIVRYHVVRNKRLGISRHEKLTLFHLEEIVGWGVVKANDIPMRKFSNIFNIWIVHSKYVEEKKLYFLDEWTFFQHLSKIKHYKVFEEDPDTSISCCDYNHDILAVGTNEGSVKVYQLSSVKHTASCISVINTHSKAVLRIILSDTMMVSCSQDCSLTVVKFLDSGSLLVSHVLQGHVSRVRCLSVFGDHILSGSDDRSAKLWSSKSSSSSALLTLSGHAWPVSQVCLSRKTAVTADSCSVRVWSLPDGGILRTLLDQANVIKILVDSRSGLLVMCYGDGGVGCCDAGQIEKGGKYTEDGSKKDMKWIFRKSNPQEKLSSKVCLGHSTMIHAICNEKQCNKVDINIHDFLC